MRLWLPAHPAPAGAYGWRESLAPAARHLRPRHRASRRRAAAEATRRAILAAARDLFLERGYVAATMPAIADRAGVALDTVYASVGRKPALFRELIETAISGRDEAAPAADRRA